MARSHLAFALVALMTLSAFLPTAAAESPSRTGWSPHDPVADTAALAIASEGTTIAAALKGPFSRQGTGSTPLCAPTNLQVYDRSAGPIYQGGWFRNPDTTCGNVPDPRSYVAVSADGGAVASLGLNRTTQTALEPSLTFTYVRAPPGVAWTPDVRTEREVRLAGTAAGLIMSASGSRVVVASNEESSYFVRGYTYESGGLSLVFTVSGVGNATALAGSADLSKIVVAARIPEAGTEHAVVRAITFTEGRSSYDYYDRRADGTAFNALVMTRDGTRYAAGGYGGTIFTFENAGASTGSPSTTTLVGGNVTRLAVSGDGSRLAGVAGSNLTHFDFTARPPAAIWTRGETFGFTSVAYNRTGGFLVAGVQSVGVLGFGDDNSTPFWTLPGANATAVVNDAGTIMAASLRVGPAQTINAYNLTRRIELSYPGGSREGDAAVAPPGGAATFETVVRNSGAVPERVRFAINGSTDFTLSSNPATPIVNPGETLRVNLTLSSSSTAPGDTMVPIDVISLTSTARDNLTATFRISAHVDVKFVYDGPKDLAARPGEPTIVLLGVRNDGTKDAAIGIRATQSVSRGNTWEIEIDRPSFVLAPTSITTLRLALTPPADTADGTADEVTLQLQGQDVAGTVRLTFRVNPSVGASIDAQGLARLIEPGKSAFYNVTVENNGTLPRDYEVIYDVSSPSGKNWVAQLDRAPIRLEPGERRAVLIQVFAPIDATSEDRATILVTARTIPEVAAETVASSSITLFANAAPVPTPTPTDEGPLGIPAPGLFLTLAITMAAVALHRRRNF